MKKLLFGLSLILISELSFTQWTKKYFVDEFGDTTKFAFIGQRCFGTFSNSATTDSELTADLCVYNDESSNYLWLRFDLYEYNRGPVVNREQFGTFKIKTANNEISECRIWHGLQIRLSRPITGKAIPELADSEALVILNKLKNETTPIKCYILLEDGSVYSFKIDPQGFASTLALLK